MQEMNIYFVYDKNKEFNGWVAVIDSGKSVFSKRGKSKYKKGVAYAVEGLCDVLDGIFYRENFDIKFHCNDQQVIDAIDSRFTTKQSINVKESDNDIWKRFKAIYLKLKSFNTYKVDKRNQHYLNAKSQMNNMLGK